MNDEKVAEILSNEITTFMSIYSLLKSKTFWTIVFNFFFTGYGAISGSLSPAVTVVVSGLLTVIAAEFHLSTGNSTSGTN